MHFPLHHRPLDSQVRRGRFSPGRWRCGHSPACTCLAESVAQSQRSWVATGRRQGQRFITLRGVREPSLRSYATQDLASSPPPPSTFSNPSKWLGPKLPTAARETSGGMCSSEPSAGDFTLKRSPFTHCPFHQSEAPPESRHPELLPFDPASGCWFILFGF